MKYEDEKEFLKKYRADISPSRKKHIKHVPASYYSYNDPLEKTHVEVEFGVQLDMSLPDFEDLLKDLRNAEMYMNEIRSLSDSVSYYQYQKRKEEELRKKHPALAKAYEKYETLRILLQNDKN